MHPVEKLPPDGDGAQAWREAGGAWEGAMRQNHAIPGLNFSQRLALIFHSTLVRALNLQRMSDALVGAATAVNEWAKTRFYSGLGLRARIGAIHLQNEQGYGFLLRNP
jgi:hypothetical protein